MKDNTEALCPETEKIEIPCITNSSKKRAHNDGVSRLYPDCTSYFAELNHSLSRQKKHEQKRSTVKSKEEVLRFLILKPLTLLCKYSITS